MANEENINDIKQKYEQIIKALEAEIKAKNREIERCNDEITWLRKLIMTLAERPININNEATATSESKSMSEATEYNFPDAKITGSNVGTNYGTQVGTQHNYAAQQNLTQAAAEIQQLLQQLEQTYPTNTPSEKMVVVEAAIKEIENDPTLKQRVIAALKSGGIEALKELIDNPLVNILLAALEGWQTGE